MMIPKNNSKLNELFKKFIPIIDGLEIEHISSDFIWSIILGALPMDYKGYEDQIMESNRKDSTIEKVDNLEMITEYVEIFTKEKTDYSYSNLESFSYALRQLTRYASGDQKAEISLIRIKELYISFISSYFIEATKNGRNKSASKNIKHFCEKILGEDRDLSIRLSQIYG